ncbi:hypothetical protein HDU96_009560 [Phlyctochytrium bullatum]|nr:hypothetical protein HDU96_009560 [Phlyctochytrium bullatum]
MKRFLSNLARTALIPKDGTYPKEFLAGAAAVGIKKKDKLDVTIVHSLKPCVAAGVFTKNVFAAAPVQVCRDILASTKGSGIRSLIVNSGCANACTGEKGLANAWDTVKQVDSAFTVQSGQPATLVMSTGVIGQPLDMTKVKAGIDALSKENGIKASHAGWMASTEGIMTTDTFPKLMSLEYRAADGTTCRMAGWSKGAGMIHPNMATMLSAVFTDANVSQQCLDHAVKYVADRSFNAISVDGDTSTNDSYVVLANGAAGGKKITDIDSEDYKIFEQHLLKISVDLSKLIVRDGEGATKFVEIKVQGANSLSDAKQVASTVAKSPLVKTAIYGKDANWGRIICAVGYSGIKVNPQAVSLKLSGKDGLSMRLFYNGAPDNVDEDLASSILKQEDIALEITIGSGNESFSMYTCDFSHEYISINADYRS